MNKLLFVPVLFLSCATLYNGSQPIPDPVNYYGGIYGTVKNSETKSLIKNVKVILKNYDSIKSDSSGSYLFCDLAAGCYSLEFTRALYDTFIIENINLAQKDIINLNVEMKSSRIKKNIQYGYCHSAGSPRSESSSNNVSKPALSGPSSNNISKSAHMSASSSNNTSKFSNESGYYKSLKKAQIPSAASHNDNEEYFSYLQFLNRFSFLKNVYHENLNDRFIIQLLDSSNHPIANQKIKILDWFDLPKWECCTYANGENVVYKNIMTPNIVDYKLKIQIANGSNLNIYPVEYPLDKIVKIILPNNDSQINDLDLLFILDTTGSMEDEIQQLKDTLYSIRYRIVKDFPNLNIRIGVVCYRDIKDSYLIKPFKFTNNFDKVDYFIDQIQAEGGGDDREDIQSALTYAIHKMNWKTNSIKISFLLGDAPPHIDYNQSNTYLMSALKANQKGIKIYTIGASGLDIEGEYIFRQIASLTYSEFIFLTYGEEGNSDESELSKVSHHTGSDYHVNQLDDLIVDCIEKELSYQFINPELISRYIPPKNRANRIRVRLDNIWYQINKQISKLYDETPNAILLPFENDNEISKGIVEYLYNESLISLVDNKYFKILERDKIEVILNERNLMLTGLIESENISKVPTMLGADIIICGEIERSGLDEVLFLRTIRCYDSEVIAAARIRL